MTEDELWAAYRAGWTAAGEGWNGEYPGIDGREATPPHEDVEDAVRQGFEHWRDHQ